MQLQSWLGTTSLILGYVYWGYLIARRKKSVKLSIIVNLELGDHASDVDGPYLIILR